MSDLATFLTAVGAVVAASASLVAAWRSQQNGGKLTQMHLDLNSRLDAALEAKYQLGLAQGRAEGKKDAEPHHPA